MSILDALIFGPVPSRRLGRSLGINNIPPKFCTYACVYCQIGRTTNMTISRQSFYHPEELVEAVERRIIQSEIEGETIDYLTLVPDGEPTLDKYLSECIQKLKILGKKVAVITNASLIWQDNVRETLSGADWVSLKIDAADIETWKDINRPHQSLDFDKIKKGILAFAENYAGTLVTESMLLRGINDHVKHVRKIADFIVQLQPATSYLGIPTRPPAERWVEQPFEKDLVRAFHIMQEQIKHVEYLVGYEGSEFSSTGNIDKDLLSITAVHPMRKEAVDVLLKKTGATWSSVDQLIRSGQLIQTEYKGEVFILRKLTVPGNHGMLGVRMQ